MPCARLIKQAAGLLRARFIPHDTRWQAARRGSQPACLERSISSVHNLWQYLLYNFYVPCIIPLCLFSLCPFPFMPLSVYTPFRLGLFPGLMEIVDYARFLYANFWRPLMLCFKKPLFHIESL
jgi:hypothetical protein